jgi:hypothetical protein
MQYFMFLIYCFYVLLTIAFMVCAAGKPLRGRSPGPRPKRSEALAQVTDRAKEKKIVLVRVGRTHNNCVEWYELM